MGVDSGIESGGRRRETQRGAERGLTGRGRKGGWQEEIERSTDNGNMHNITIGLKAGISYTRFKMMIERSTATGNMNSTMISGKARISYNTGIERMTGVGGERMLGSGGGSETFQCKLARRDSICNREAPSFGRSA